MQRRRLTRPVVVICLLLVLYLIGAFWLIPAFIRDAYAGRSWDFLNGLISGQDTHPVEHYLERWRRLAVYLGPAVLLIGLGLTNVRRIVDSLRAWGASRPVLRDGDVLLAVLALGIVSGLAESLSREIGYWLLLRPTGDLVTSAIFWMAPVAASTALLLVAMPVVAARRLLGAGFWVNHALLFVLVTLCVYGLAGSARLGVHPAALWVLSVGVASMVTRSAASDGRMMRVTRRGAVAALAGVLLWAALQPWRTSRYFAVDEWRPRNAQPRAPNVIVLIWDTVRSRSLSTYGYIRQTSPNLDRLAARSAVFENAISTSPWTLPSHASLFTGLSAQAHGADRGAPLPDSLPTLAEALAARGYQTAGFVANTYWLGRGFGLHRGFQWYSDRAPINSGTTLTTWSWTAGLLDQRARQDPWIDSPLRLSARDVRTGFERWLDRRQAAPFFAFINFFDAHEPYIPPDGYGFRFSTGKPLARYSISEAHSYSPGDLQELRDAYDSSIHYVDDQFGKLLDGLERRGLLQNTIIVVTADHGETLGEHRPDLLGHDNNMYDDVLRIPLVIYTPSGMGSRERITAPASIADVPATIMDLLDAGAGNPFPGRALLRNDDAPSRFLSAYATPADWHEDIEAFPISRGPMRSLHLDSWHYLVDGEGQESLYDLSRDPWELTNRADDPGTSTRLAAFRDALAHTTSGGRVATSPPR